MTSVRSGLGRGLRRAPSLLLALLAGTGAGWPQATNDDCLSCHADPELTRAADGSSVAFPAASFEASVHGAFASCVDCHTDPAVQEPDHPVEIAPPDCAGCHAEPVAAAQTGAHARRDERGRPAATCWDCHGAHDIRSSSEFGSRTHPLQIPATCGRCHGATGPGADRLGDVAAAYRSSVHGRGLLLSGLIVSAECTDCHGAHEILRSDDPQSRVHRQKVAATCGTCHVGIEPIYRASIHGEKVEAGDEKAPSCAGCHSSHSIRPAMTEQWRVDVIEECGTCHAQSLETYRDTFHGQVTELGFTRVATCAGCHGAHDVLPKDRPESRISDSRRLATCQTCHPGAPSRFASYDPHANSQDRERSPTVYWTAKAMTGLLIGTFAFFLTHTGMWLMRELRGPHRGKR